MFERIQVKSFESLYDVDIKLGQFTVILGQSSQGKSAFIRSIHALCNNIQGNSHVTHGHKFSTITATLTDWVVSLERGEGHSQYILTNRHTGKIHEPFRKLNKKVPEEIKDILYLDSTNFAMQESSAYLLGDSGHSVARVLGELTNVIIIFEAAAEGNKQRDSLASRLKEKREDLVQANQDLETFKDLPDKVNRASLLEELMTSVDLLKSKFDILSSIITDFTDARSVLDTTPSYPKVPDIADMERVKDSRRRLRQFIDEFNGAETALRSTKQYPPVPDIGDIVDLCVKRNTLSDLYESFVSSLSLLSQAKMEWIKADNAKQDHEKTLHQLLVESGTCPTCQQKVTP